MAATPARLAEFLEAATWHGPLDRAEALLKAHPEIAASGIHAAAVLGDDAAVRRFIAADPASATGSAPPYDGDALCYLGLSKYLRLEPARSEGFLRAATALLDAGANPNTGFWTSGDRPEFETALYGAAGVAHHEPLTRLLLARGADPNDEEAVYHSPESRDLGAMKALVETGRVTPDNLSMMLIRKHDWHDLAGVLYLLAHGTDPNHPWRGGRRAIHHAIERDNDREIVEALLDHGADPSVREHGLTATARAARRGRHDLLAAFERREIATALTGVDRLVAACARGDAAEVRAIARSEPTLVPELVSMGGDLLAEFAGTWNADGVALLLDLGVPVGARYAGDGYFEIAPDSTALHVAAWKGTARVVEQLIERGAAVDAVDAKGRTPLMLAVKACVDSHWTERRTPETVRLLLGAGASTAGVPQPSGYVEVDRLLAAHGA